MTRKLNIVEVDLGKRGDVNVTIEDFDCTGEQPMYNPLGGFSKSLMFAASAIKYKMQCEELNAELATLRAENEKLREVLNRIYDDKRDMIAPNWVRLIAKEAMK